MEKQLPASFEIPRQIKDRFRDESRKFFPITLQQIPLHSIPTQLLNVLLNCQGDESLYDGLVHVILRLLKGEKRSHQLITERSSVALANLSA